MGRQGEASVVLSNDIIVTGKEIDSLGLKSKQCSNETKKMPSKITFNTSCSSSYSTCCRPRGPQSPLTVDCFTFTVCCLLFCFWRLSTRLRQPFTFQLLHCSLEEDEKSYDLFQSSQFGKKQC